MPTYRVTVANAHLGTEANIWLDATTEVHAQQTAQSLGLVTGRIEPSNPDQQIAIDALNRIAEQCECLPTIAASAASISRSYLLLHPRSSIALGLWLFVLLPIIIWAIIFGMHGIGDSLHRQGPLAPTTRFPSASDTGHAPR